MPKHDHVYINIVLDIKNKYPCKEKDSLWGCMSFTISCNSSQPIRGSDRNLNNASEFMII